MSTVGSLYQTIYTLVETRGKKEKKLNKK